MHKGASIALWRCTGPTALVLAGFALFAVNDGFRLGLHPDEVRWTADALSGRYEFVQPLLLREVTGFAVRGLGIVEPQRSVEIGRLLCAAAAAAGIAGLYILVAARAGRAAALIAAAAAALTPLLAIHAHYFKDDALLFAACVWSVVALRRLWARPSAARVAALGAAMGLAVASKEPGVFLWPVFALGAALHPGGRRLARLAELVAAGGLTVAVALATNLPMLLDPARAWSGLASETGGIFAGHWDGVAYGIGFHLTHSLWRGVGPVFLVIAAAGAALALGRRHRAAPLDRVMLIYAAVYYAVIELSPLKPWPDPDRYALPLLVPLSYFLGLALAAAEAWLRRLRAGARGRAAMAALAWSAAAALVLLPGAATTLPLIAGLADDTRDRADRILAGRDAAVLSELYGSSIGRQVHGLAEDDGGDFGPAVRYVVASSFSYGRYAYGAAVGGAENRGAAARWARYQALFRHPYCEIRPDWPTYAFSNPTLRIVDIAAAPAVGGAADQPAPDCSPAFTGR